MKGAIHSLLLLLALFAMLIDGAPPPPFSDERILSHVRCSNPAQRLPVLLLSAKNGIK
jgi:hypothetical protein